jgi:hypothetical protein
VIPKLERPTSPIQPRSTSIESTTQLTLAIDATNATSSLDVAKSAAGHPRTLSREKRIKYARKRP